MLLDYSGQLAKIVAFNINDFSRSFQGSGEVFSWEWVYHPDLQEAQTEALELTAYVLVLTSVDGKLFPAKAVLDLYRGRWQIELVFKRLKSLLEAGHVPKSDDDSAKAWMQAKILSALLVDRVLLEGKFFSPWGFAL